MTFRAQVPTLQGENPPPAERGTEEEAGSIRHDGSQGSTQTGSDPSSFSNYLSGGTFVLSLVSLIVACLAFRRQKKLHTIDAESKYIFQAFAAARRAFDCHQSFFVEYSTQQQKSDAASDYNSLVDIASDLLEPLHALFPKSQSIWDAWIAMTISESEWINTKSTDLPSPDKIKGIKERHHQSFMTFVKATQERLGKL